MMLPFQNPSNDLRDVLDGPVRTISERYLCGNACFASTEVSSLFVLSEKQSKAKPELQSKHDKAVRVLESLQGSGAQVYQCLKE